MSQGYQAKHHGCRGRGPRTRDFLGGGVHPLPYPTLTSHSLQRLLSVCLLLYPGGGVPVT